MAVSDLYSSSCSSSLYYYRATLRIDTAGSATLVRRVWVVVSLTFGLAIDWIISIHRTIVKNTMIDSR